MTYGNLGDYPLGCDPTRWWRLGILTLAQVGAYGAGAAGIARRKPADRAEILDWITTFSSPCETSIGNATFRRPDLQMEVEVTP